MFSMCDGICITDDLNNQQTNQLHPNVATKWLGIADAKKNK